MMLKLADFSKRTQILRGCEVCPAFCQIADLRRRSSLERFQECHHPKLLKHECGEEAEQGSKNWFALCELADKYFCDRRLRSSK